MTEIGLTTVKLFSLALEIGPYRPIRNQVLLEQSNCIIHLSLYPIRKLYQQIMSFS